MSQDETKYQFNAISNKKDFGSLGIPNYIIEYDPLNLMVKCPRFHRFTTNENSEIKIEDLDQIQLEMETLLIDTMKRLRLLKNELNANEIILLKKNMEATASKESINLNLEVKQLKEKTFEKYFDRVTFKSKDKSFLQPNYEIIERFIGAPYPRLNENDTPNQFWSFVHYFHDLSPTVEELKLCANFLDGYQMGRDLPRLHSPPRKPSHKNDLDDFEENDDKDVTTENFQDELSNFLENYSKEFLNSNSKVDKFDFDCYSSSHPSYGPLTQRLMSSMIKTTVHENKAVKIGDDECEIIEQNISSEAANVTTTKKDVYCDSNADITITRQDLNQEGRSIQINQSQAHEFERSLYQVLKRLQLIPDPIPKDKLFKIRRSIRKMNPKSFGLLRKNFKHAFNDVIQEKIDQKLRSTFLKMFSTYKAIQSSKSTSMMTNNVVDYQTFDQLWQTRTQLIKYLNLFNRI